MDTQSKGLMPGALTAWYTVLVVAAVFHGLGFLQDFFAVISVNEVLSSPYGLRMMIVILLEAAAFILPVLAAKDIYRHNRRGCTLAYVSAWVGVVLILFTILFSEFFGAMSAILRAVLCIAVVSPAKRAKEYLFTREGLDQNDFM